MEKFLSKNVHANFVLRVPSLPYEIDKLSEDYLAKSFNNPFIKEALYNASPFLFSELEKLYNNEIKDQKKKNKLLITFGKYCTRMQSRCTPYGLFASCSIGKFGENSKLTISHFEETEKTLRHTRPDMNYLCEYSHQLSLLPNIRPFLKFYPNSSIYKIGSQLRYIEYKFIDSKRHYQISSVDDSEYLQAILKSCDKGNKIEEMVNLLVREEISDQESLFFINELIDNQIIVSELEPTLTGPEYIYQLIDRLATINKVANEPQITDAIQLLTKLQGSLDTCDYKKINNVAFYRELFSKLKSDKIEIEENQLFQIDLFRNNSSLELSYNVKEDIIRTYNFLDKLISPFENSYLKQFKDNFYKRYETKEVSLLEVIDTETGIGFPSKDLTGSSKLIDDLITISGNSDQAKLSWKKKDQFLFGKYLEAYKNESHSIQILDSDLSDNETKLGSLPHTFSVVFKVLNHKGKLQIISWGGSSAANILGRFAHGSKEIESIIHDVTAFEKEQMSDKIVAEILHLPYSRLGNILLRPVFREYEIPFLVQSTLDSEHQIHVSDLFVSIKNDKIILRSKKFNKEVIPRLTSAHNYTSNTLPLYHFLGELQGQYFEKKYLNFDWGMVENIANFLPRVEYNNVILSAAKWKFNKSDLPDLADDKVGMEIIASWKLKNKLPRKVLITESDNELLIDFENVLSVNILIEFMKRKNDITLTEFLFDEENMLASDVNGNKYTNECIAILYAQNNVKTNEILEISKEADTNHITEIKRQFIAGDEWLYYKFYCGIKSADKILTECISPLMEIFCKKNVINNWFFIRYADPDWHIRLRLQLNSVNEIGNVINFIRNHIEGYVSSALISKVEISDYNRELERYNFSNITFAEKYFGIDSTATIKFLNLIDQGSGDILRLQFAIKAVDDLLSSFRLDLKSKLNVMEQIQYGFVIEHGGEKLLKVPLDNKYRFFKKHVNDILSDGPLPEELRFIFDILNAKKERTDILIMNLLESIHSKTSTTSINELIGSYLHMTLNRIFYSSQRKHEMLIYYLLYKYYKSKVAIGKKKNEHLVSETN